MKTLCVGDRGSEVRQLQLPLDRVGELRARLRPDGHFGPRTAEAVRAFQKLKGLPVDGVVGATAWSALGVVRPSLRRPSTVPDAGGPKDWMAIASAEIGVQEIMGRAHNRRIIDYHATTRLKAQSDEVPWCSAFVNWVLKKANIAGTNNAAAMSWITWGTALQTPRRGAVTVTKKPRADHDNGSSSGWHVGFSRAAPRRTSGCSGAIREAIKYAASLDAQRPTRRFGFGGRADRLAVEGGRSVWTRSPSGRLRSAAAAVV